jgi:hypothetical protein
MVDRAETGGDSAQDGRLLVRYDATAVAEGHLWRAVVVVTVPTRAGTLGRSTGVLVKRRRIQLGVHPNREDAVNQAARYLGLRASLALWTDFPQDRAVLNLAPRKLDATSRKASYVA